MFRYMLNNPYEVNGRDLTARTIENPTIVECLSLSHRLPLHNGCINTVDWDCSGQFLLSGSDDRRLIISNPFSRKILENRLTSHKNNIFSARFLPNLDTCKVVSCAGDGSVIVTDFEAELSSSESLFTCHSGTTYDVIPVESEPNTFFSVGEDGSVRWFDLRLKSKCTDRHCKEDVLFRYRTSCTSLAINSLMPYEMAVGTSDSHVYIMDRRKINSCGSGLSAYESVVSQLSVPDLSCRSCQVTSVKFSPDGYELLASYSGDSIYLFGLKGNANQVASVGDISEAFVPEDDSQNSGPRHRQLPNFRRIRLRGDWSDTGPTAGVEESDAGRSEIGQARPTVQANLMRRMADVFSTMLQRTSQRGVPSAASPSVSMESDAPGPSFPSNVQAAPVSSSEVIDCVTYESLGAAESAAESPPEEASSAAANEESSFETPRRPSLSSGISLNELEESILADCSTSPSDVVLESTTVFKINPKAKFTGHRNARTIINEASFWGSKHIMSGSDCGHVFVWDRTTGRVVNILEADTRVVNRIRPHPQFPILATSGIDYDVKIWMPTAEPQKARIDVSELMERNARMLEATRDTVVVPATFIMRMLATLSHMRRSGSRLTSESDNNPDV